MEQFKEYKDLNFSELRAFRNKGKGKLYTYQCISEDQVVYETKTDRTYFAILVIRHNENNWQCYNRFGMGQELRIHFTMKNLTSYDKFTLFYLQGPHPETHGRND